VVCVLVVFRHGLPCAATTRPRRARRIESLAVASPTYPAILSRSFFPTTSAHRRHSEGNGRTRRAIRQAIPQTGHRARVAAVPVPTPPTLSKGQDVRPAKAISAKQSIRHRGGGRFEGRSGHAGASRADQGPLRRRTGALPAQYSASHCPFVSDNGGQSPHARSARQPIVQSVATITDISKGRRHFRGCRRSSFNLSVGRAHLSKARPRRAPLDSWVSFVVIAQYRKERASHSRKGRGSGCSVG
jgi:hypothetical protein